MFNVYLSLGTNLGDRQANLQHAVAHIEKEIGRKVCLSAFYETEPWGFTSPNAFLNAAMCVETSLSPSEVLEATQRIEKEIGRTRKSVNGQYADRLIDIDLLLMGEVVMQTERLTLPHPLMHRRLFVMEPMVEIAPTVVHPVLHKTICEIYNTLKQ